MDARVWLKTWFKLFIIVMPIVAIINYAIDPFWLFKHAHKLNSIQKPFNERQQKTNHIYFNGMEKYDGILLGSSRTTYINQNDFGTMNIYNYSSNSGRPVEFKGFIDFAQKCNGKDLKYIIIGADFFATDILLIVKSEDPQFYIDTVEQFAYKYKTLLSFSALKESFKNISSSIKGKVRVYYDRENVKYRPRKSDEKRVKSYNSNIKSRTDAFSDKNYAYDDNYIKRLKEIKRLNPNTKFIIFTSPISANLLVSILKNHDRMDEFERWLKEMIEVFGEVHHFMTINSVTQNLKNYRDAEHYHENIGRLLANKIAGVDNNSTEDFGIILNRDNIDDYLHKFKKQI